MRQQPSISSRPRSRCDQSPPHVCGRRSNKPCWTFEKAMRCIRPWDEPVKKTDMREPTLATDLHRRRSHSPRAIATKSNDQNRCRMLLWRLLRNCGVVFQSDLLVEVSSCTIEEHGGSKDNVPRPSARDPLSFAWIHDCFYTICTLSTPSFWLPPNTCVRFSV